MVHLFTYGYHAGAARTSVTVTACDALGHRCPVGGAELVVTLAPCAHGGRDAPRATKPAHKPKPQPFTFTFTFTFTLHFHPSHSPFNFTLTLPKATTAWCML